MPTIKYVPCWNWYRNVTRSGLVPVSSFKDMTRSPDIRLREYSACLKGSLMWKENTFLDITLWFQYTVSYYVFKLYCNTLLSWVAQFMNSHSWEQLLAVSENCYIDKHETLHSLLTFYKQITFYKQCPLSEGMLLIDFFVFSMVPLGWVKSC